MTEAIKLTGWEKCTNCGERCRMFAEDSTTLCLPCYEARVRAEEQAMCASRCDVLAIEAQYLSEMWLRKDEVRRSESFADKYYAYREAAKWIRGDD